MNPFTRDDYRACWRAHVAPALRLDDHDGAFRVAVESRCKGALPWRRLAAMGVENDWAMPLTPQRLSELERLAGRARWDDAQLLCYDDELSADGLPPGLPPALSQVPFARTAVGAEYAASLAGGYDAFLSGLSSKVRCEIRRKEKKAQPLRPVCRLLNDDADWPALWTRFCDLHGDYWRTRGGRSLLADPAQRACWQAWLTALAPDRALQFWGAFLNDDLCSMRVGLRADGVYYSILTVNTGAHAEHTPGGLLLQAEILAQCEAGCHTFNLGPGFERYKQQLGAAPRLMSRITLANPRSLRGRLALKARSLRTRRG